MIFEGSSSCHDQRGFLQAFQTRLDEVRLVPSTGQGVVRVQIRETNEGYESSLTILLADGESLHRSISAPSCVEAIEGIAFVTAVALDPASHQPLELGRVEPEPEPVSTQHDSPTTHRSSETTHRWSLGMSATGHFGIAPRPMAGGLVGVGWQTTVPGWWAPSLRLAFDASFLRGHRTSDGIADFSLYQGTLLVCPSRAQWRSVFIWPCLAGGGGALRASGRATFDARSATRPWGWSGAALLVGVQLHSHLNLLFDAEVGFPGVRDRFLLEGREFHTTNVAFGTVSLGIEVLFGDRSSEVVH